MVVVRLMYQCLPPDLTFNFICRKEKDLNFEIDAYTRCANIVGHNSTTYAKEFIEYVTAIGDRGGERRFN